MENAVSEPVLALSEGAPQPPLPFFTLSDALKRAARTSDNQIVFILDDGAEDRCTYAELLADAERILGGLSELGLRPGDPVILQLSQNRRFLTFFWACQLGGFITVPIAVPAEYSGENINSKKLVNSCSMFERATVALSSAQLEKVSKLLADNDLTNTRVAVFEDLWQINRSGEPVISETDDLTLLLLTSGSTGMPKAVQHTHRTILSRTVSAVSHNGFDESEVTVNWFPLDHVVGLIMFHFRDVFLACRQIHAPTNWVLHTPLRWLEMMSAHRATISWAPNFGFALINDLEEQLRQGAWDLRSVKLIMNAGEVIVPRTARRFLSLLGPFGLKATSTCPVWGMSETVSGVTYESSFSLETTADDDPHVSVGGPIPGFSMRITDSGNFVLKEGQVGSLQVLGEFITPGYYQNPKENAESFTPDGWFITGDLGMIVDGKLTITGREKDIMVVNGIIFHGHEIESAVEELPGLDTSFTVAIGIRNQGDDTDRIVIFFKPLVESEDELLHLIKRVRGQVARSFGISPQYLIPVEQGEVPKTEIGKLQRTKIKQMFLDGQFEDRIRSVEALLARDNDKRSIRGHGSEAKVFDIWAETLGHELFGIDDNFFEVGGGSLKAMHLCAAIEDISGLIVPLITVFDRPTVRQLAAWLDGGEQIERLTDMKARIARGKRRRQKRLESWTHVNVEDTKG